MSKKFKTIVSIFLGQQAVHASKKIMELRENSISVQPTQKNIVNKVNSFFFLYLDLRTLSFSPKMSVCLREWFDTGQESVSSRISFKFLIYCSLSQSSKESKKKKKPCASERAPTTATPPPPPPKQGRQTYFNILQAPQDNNLYMYVLNAVSPLSNAPILYKPMLSPCHRNLSVSKT